MSHPNDIPSADEPDPAADDPSATTSADPAGDDSPAATGTTTPAAGSPSGEAAITDRATGQLEDVDPDEQIPLELEEDPSPDAETGSRPASGAEDEPASRSSSDSGAGTGTESGAAAGRNGRKSEWLYFAARNPKVVGGAGVLATVLLVGLIAPLFLSFEPRERNVGPQSAPPSADHWFGTTKFGEDVFTQFVYGIRATFMVAVLAAALAALIGMTIGFVAGYRGGLVDELLMTITNIVLVLPVFVVLIVVTAYLGINNVPTQAVIIGLFQWPWVARAVRAQTFSLRTRDYVDLARLTGSNSLTIIRREIAPNMASYLVMTFILLFAGAVLFAAALDFLGLGPRQGMSLGLMLQLSNEWGAALLGWWWWFIPPGATITLITGAAYVTNVGLDEVFNPKLREQ
jgi:peptide/nickel transport system permease protein